MSLLNRRSLIAFLSLAALAVVVTFSGCGFPTHINPPVYERETQLVAFMEAQLHARDLPDGPGLTFTVQPTGSMEPTIKGGDIIVVDTNKENHSKLRAGEIITYKADWYKGVEPVTHRLIKKDSYGWLLSGDANPDVETKWRVTENSYVGKVVAIYRVKPTVLAKPKA